MDEGTGTGKKPASPIEHTDDPQTPSTPTRHTGDLDVMRWEHEQQLRRDNRQSPFSDAAHAEESELSGHAVEAPLSYSQLLEGPLEDVAQHLWMYRSESQHSDVTTSTSHESANTVYAEVPPLMHDPSNDTVLQESSFPQMFSQEGFAASSSPQMFSQEGFAASSFPQMFSQEGFAASSFPHLPQSEVAASNFPHLSSWGLGEPGGMTESPPSLMFEEQRSAPTELGEPGGMTYPPPSLTLEEQRSAFTELGEPGGMTYPPRPLTFEERLVAALTEIDEPERTSFALPEQQPLGDAPEPRRSQRSGGGRRKASERQETPRAVPGRRASAQATPKAWWR